MLVDHDPSITNDNIRWGQRTEDMKPLTRDQWRRWAARTYRQYRAQESRPPVPHSEASKLPDLWLTLTETQTRLLCASLAVRAAQLGWRDIGQQWAYRYWQRTPQLDTNQNLEAAMATTKQLEHNEQARLLYK